MPPVRTKDRAYLDVLSESVNDPLRLLMGWFAIIPDALPPSSLILAPNQIMRRCWRGSHSAS